MSFGANDVLLLVLRAIGALWIAGGTVLIRHVWMSLTIGRAIENINQAAAEAGLDPKEDPDNGREYWLLAGGALTVGAGAAMLIGHRAAVALLAALIVQQLGYFVRQRRRELAAKTEQDAEEARPDRTTVNGFFTSLIMAVLAGYLFYVGKLWG